MSLILFEDIYDSINEKTEIIIQDENWEELEKLFRISPKQITLFSQQIEEKIKNSQQFSEPPLRKRESDSESIIDYYYYTWVFEISLEILKKDGSFFSREFKIELCSKIFSFMKANRVNSAVCESFALGLFETIDSQYHDELIEVPYLLPHMIKINPDVGVSLFPKIVEKEYYEQGFDILRNEPDLIETHNDEVKKIFQNIILNNTQYRKYVPPLIEKDDNLKLIIEKHRLKLKYEYYHDKMSPELDLDQVDIGWLSKNEHIFSFCFNLYDDSELKNIIERLIDLNIEYSYENKKSVWIIHLLLTISWSRKREIFANYLNELTELKYYQVVKDYFFQFPEKIKDNQDLILKLQYFSLDLLEKKLEFFQIDNPVDLFKDYLHKQYNTIVLRRVFYQKFPDFKEDFNEAIKNYLNQIDVSILDKNQEYIIYHVENLLELIYGYYSVYVPEFGIDYFQEVLDKFLAVEWIAKTFNPVTSLYIASNFEEFGREFQQKIIDLVVDNNRLTCIENFLDANFNAFEPHLNKILEYNAKEPLESIHFVKVISKIVKKSIENQEIYQKAIDILQELEDCPEKAEIFLFLGDLEQSKEILKKLLDSELSLPYALNLTIDYNSILCELAIKNSQTINTPILLSELSSIDSNIKNYSSDSTILQNFTFKRTNLEARLSMYSGFNELQNNNTARSVGSFEKAISLLERLKSTKVIKDTTRNILQIYHDISIFFRDNVNTILDKLRQSVEKVNQYLDESLDQLLNEIDQSNIQNKRIYEEIQNLRFKSSTTIYNINYELPTKFCPKPPLIGKSTLRNINDEVVQEWNEKREPQIDEPIEISFGSSKFTLEIEFKEKEKYYNFDVEIRQDANLNITLQKIDKEYGKISFSLRIVSESFDGIRNFTHLLKEQDLCGFNFELSSEIIHEDYASLEKLIIEDLLEEIPKFKGRTLKYLDYLEFLRQFSDPEIRSGVLRHILKRLPTYYLTIDKMIIELKQEIQRLHYDEEKDDLFFCILNQLEGKSPSFCQYLTQNFITYGRYNIEIIKSTTLLKRFKKNTPSKTTHIIFLDDTIGSGRQFVKFYKSDFEPIYRKHKLNKNNHLNFYIIASKGSYESIQYISQNTIFAHTNIHYCKIIRNPDKAFNSSEWKDDKLLAKVKDFLKLRDNKYWDSRKEEGQKRGLEYLVVNEWTVPNNTIGCLWNTKGKWRPLFPRA